MKYYCGVGSRETPSSALAMMRRIAAYLVDCGYTLRSGHAEGADQAFERGAEGKAEIFLPWKSFNSSIPICGKAFFDPTPEAETLAAEIHPSWTKLSNGGRKLHARNCHQVLGPDLDDPVDFVVCWTPGGRMVGGTATAIRIARREGIHVHNLGRSKDLAVVSSWLT